MIKKVQLQKFDSNEVVSIMTALAGKEITIFGRKALAVGYFFNKNTGKHYPLFRNDSDPHARSVSVMETTRILNFLVPDDKLGQYHGGSVFEYDDLSTSAGPPSAPQKKAISQWPHKCRCGAPALIMATSVDCSDPACRQKFSCSVRS